MTFIQLNGTDCGICGPPHKLHEFEEHRFACDNCKRIWYNKDGEIISEPRTVVLAKPEKPKS